ncbi:hypothetical protein K2X30_03815 [bacterium]|jgi:hypothetical protein|nr:hypothetical protein [bacterium]
MSARIRVFFSLLLTPLLLIQMGCETPFNLQITAGQSQVTVNPDQQVCNPFGGGSSAGRNHGLKAKLSYAPSNATVHPQVLGDFLTMGTPVNVDLFFNDVFVPTRPFDSGFLTQAGNVLTTPNGDTLYEWFRIDFESNVVLGSSDPVGKYQFALMSDDGSLLKIKEFGQYNILVNNDRTTSSSLKCASRSVEMNASTMVPIQLGYFQGPRYHIALAVLWRQVPANLSPADEALFMVDQACDTYGNGQFFDSTQNPPAPSSVWNGMMSRGWKVLKSENYLLPGTTVNPCDAPIGI